MTDTNILSTDVQAWLNATFDRNRRTYGGLTMMADEGGDKDESGASTNGTADPEGKSGTGTEGDAGKSTEQKSEEQLGDGGKRALEAERKARQEIKGELDQLKNSLAEALGVKAEKEQGEGGDLLATLQEKVAGMQREAAVLRLANQHKITDQADLDLLAQASDETRESLAKRLAPSNEGGTGNPRPDHTQGGAGGEGDEAKAGSVKSAREDYLERRKKKTA